MEAEKYPNIRTLNNLYIKHQVSIQISDEVFLMDKKYYPEVILTLDKKSFRFFVDDEYEDFRYNYPILNFCVVLRELEDYKFSNDYLLWCAERHIDASNLDIREYYMAFNAIYNEIEGIIGKINSFIPDNDFEFGMGEIWILREENY